MHTNPVPTRLSVSVVIATAQRHDQLVEAIRCLSLQERLPDEVIIVDGAVPPGVEMCVTNLSNKVDIPIRYIRCLPPSAARQRNAGAQSSVSDIVLFIDDDAYLRSDCIEKMVGVLEADAGGEIGGVGVLIENQPCDKPSNKAKLWLDFLADTPLASYSGRVVGPCINIGAEGTVDGRLVEVEWLNSGCTAYRKHIFLEEMFCPRFFGYSYMEDVDLSVRIARKYKLIVHTGAFFFHDTRPSVFKRPFVRSVMTVKNRYYVMTETLGRTSVRHHVKFVLSFCVYFSYSLIKANSIGVLYQKVPEAVGLAIGFVSIMPRALVTSIRAVIGSSGSISRMR